MSIEHIVGSAAGGWISAGAAALGTVAPRLPSRPRATSIEAVDLLLEHSRAAAATIARVQLGPVPERVDRLAEARCHRVLAARLQPQVEADFGAESPVCGAAADLVATLEDAEWTLEQAIAAGDRLPAEAPRLVTGLLSEVRLAQTALARRVWEAVARVAG